MRCGRKIGPFDCCSVVQGDCLELMKQLPDRCVDACIADPPYGISLNCSKRWVGGNGVWLRNYYPDVYGDDKPFDPSLLLAFGWPLILWGANHYADKLPASSGWLVWDKERPEELSQSTCELAWTNCVKGVRRFRYLWNGMLRASDETIYHPTQKPLALMQWCVEKVNAETILDPFCGSGTTLVAAAKLGRHFLGFEISPEYCEIARKRIAAVEAQPSLFTPKPEQLSLEAK